MTVGRTKIKEGRPEDYKLMLVNGTTFAPLCEACVPEPAPAE